MKQAMILAAGLGTRLKPLTDTMPKALVPVGGKPLLEWNIRKLQAQGYDRFVINIHHFAQQIRDYVAQQDYAPLVHFSDETSQLLETGGGLKHAQNLFSDEEPILIHNVDILDNVDYAWFARQHQTDEDAVLLVSQRKTKRYLLFDNAMHLMGWKNIETGEVKGCEGRSLAFSGIHLLGPNTFPLFDQMPDRFGIIDFYLKFCQQYVFLGNEKRNLRLLDVGKLDSLEQAEQFLK